MYSALAGGEPHKAITLLRMAQRGPASLLKIFSAGASSDTVSDSSTDNAESISLLSPSPVVPSVPATLCRDLVCHDGLQTLPAVPVEALSPLAAAAEIACQTQTAAQQSVAQYAMALQSYGHFTLAAQQVRERDSIVGCC